MTSPHPPERREWLAAPAVVLFAIDATLTLAGQPRAYWSGDHAAVVEANPLAHRVLALGPAWFAGLGFGWVALVIATTRLAPRNVAIAAAVLVSIGHAIGGATWIARHGPLGLAAAIAYLALAARASAACWRRASLEERPDAIDAGSDA